MLLEVLFLCVFFIIATIIFADFCTLIETSALAIFTNKHYHDVIMTAMASQITSLTIVYSIVQILIEIHILSFKKMRLKMSSAKRRPYCLGLNH